MKANQTKTYHISELGQYVSHAIVTSGDGWVVVHDSPIYADANESELEAFSWSPQRDVRNAALAERAKRIATAMRG